MCLRGARIVFNYYNLNDVEFEELCKDVMEKVLCTSLRIFAKGRDGGIDLTDNVKSHNIVVQVKHYINSKYSDLRTTLSKEIDKVRVANPNRYYICCGMKLTDSNICEVYNMFSDYMESDRNIFTLIEIDDFLQNPENNDIIRKHYKLWLYASNILSEIYNQNIFIDCESLLSDIDEDCRYFVQTSSYEECLECLEKNRVIMMVGAPGVGKTVTSKMLILYFANKDYRVRYTTNGDITDIKRSLSGDSNCKEIVLLDDCLGQHYFNMKESQENELISLVKYIKMNPNKMLILNSRITIYNEAKERSEEFKIFVQGEKIKIHTINMDLISKVEKARIFYNHLVSKNVPRDYYNDIKKDKRYLKIVGHPNYTPRIIEYITNKYRYSSVPPEKYYEYIFETLSQPNDIWKNEFERRLKDIDRAFMSTLYSLTDTSIDCETFKKCFYNRLRLMNGVDYTVDNYELTLTRLNGSLVSVVDNRGKRQIGVMNPSINDYLKSVFSKNTLELTAVRKAIVYYIQMQRCYSNIELKEILHKNLVDGGIFEVLFNNEFEKEHFIVSEICKHEIMNELYNSMILLYLNNTNGYIATIKDMISKIEIVDCLSKEPLCSFYNFTKIICNKIVIENIFEDMTLEELANTIDIIFNLLQRTNVQTNALDWLVTLCCSKIDEAMLEYVESTDTASYCENYDVRDVISDNTQDWFSHDGNSMYTEFDKDSTLRTIQKWIESDIKDELTNIIAELPTPIKNKIDISSIIINVNHSEILGVIESAFEPDIDYDDYDHSDGENSISIIDAIFERD